MGRPSFNQVNDLPDPATTESYVFRVIPPGGDTANIALRCISFILPDEQIEEGMRLELFGNSVSWPGRRIQSHIFDAVFIESVEGSIQTVFRNWIDTVVSLKTGSTSAGFKPPGQIEIYDTKGKLIWTIKFDAIWPTHMQSVSLDAQGGQIFHQQISFHFNQFIYVSNGNIINPLKMLETSVESIFQQVLPPVISSIVSENTSALINSFTSTFGI